MKTRFFAFAALALTLAACNNDNEILNNDGPVAAKFTADIGNNVTATPSTRVSGTDGDLWDNGDCIGITGAGGLHQHPLCDEWRRQFHPEECAHLLRRPE